MNTILLLMSLMGVWERPFWASELEPTYSFLTTPFSEISESEAWFTWDPSYIAFVVHSEEIFRIHADGRIYYRDRLLTKDLEILAMLDRISRGVCCECKETK